jgi:energy-converting hydrogenase Eha subunit C
MEVASLSLFTETISTITLRMIVVILEEEKKRRIKRSSLMLQ